MRILTEYCKQISLNEYLSTKVKVTRGFPENFDVKEIGHYCELNGLNEYKAEQIRSIDVYPIVMYIISNTPYSSLNKLEYLLYCDYPVDTFSSKAILITYEKKDKSNAKINPVCHFITYDDKTNEMNVISHESHEDSIVNFDIRKLHIFYGFNSAIKVKVERIEEFEKFRATINDIMERE